MKWREKAGLAHLGLSAHAAVSIWTLGDKWPSGSIPEQGIATSTAEWKQRFVFFYRNLETLTGVLELQEIELARCGEHNCNEYHLAHRGLCY